MLLCFLLHYTIAYLTFLYLYTVSLQSLTCIFFPLFTIRIIFLAISRAISRKRDTNRHRHTAKTTDGLPYLPDVSEASPQMSFISSYKKHNKDNSNNRDAAVVDLDFCAPSLSVSYRASCALPLLLLDTRAQKTNLTLSYTMSAMSFCLSLFSPPLWHGLWFSPFVSVCVCVCACMYVFERQ